MQKTVVCRDINDNHRKIRADKLAFQPAVYGIMIKNNKVLLSPQLDGYDYPGGRIDKGERLEAALKREFWEETGLKVEAGELVAAADDFFIRPYTNELQHSVMLYYLVKRVSGKITDKYLDKYEKDYVKIAEWVEIKKFSQLKFYNALDNKKVIKRAIKLIDRIKI